MRRSRRILLGLLVAALTTPVLWAWPWSRDMVVQIFIGPQQQVFLPAPNAVAVNAEPPRSREAAAARLQNPLTARPERLERGKRLFEVYCYPCHGLQGQGDGPVAGGALVPADLTAARVQAQPDGALYHTIRHGLGSMAAYYARLSPEERWLVILYVRTLGEEGRR